MRCCTAARRTVASHRRNDSIAKGSVGGALMKVIWLAAAAASLGASAMAQHPAHMGHSDMAAPKTPMLPEGYGGGGVKITANNPRAQAFFCKGMEIGPALPPTAGV